MLKQVSTVISAISKTQALQSDMFPTTRNEDLKRKLKNILVRSVCIQEGERRALCTEINLSPSSLPFLNRGSDESFAEELINYLFNQKKKESLCQLCQKLESEVREGEFENDLVSIKEEVCNSNNSLITKNSSIISLKQRQQLLNNVSKSRVDPFINIKNKLIKKELIALDLELSRVKTLQEKELLEGEGREPPINLLPDTKIINIFDNEMHDRRTLLILGEPGSGKTTILGELTSELIKRASENDNLPIPVILNLVD
ncbi:hypothetical protein WA1_25375 [Scytonema hofmannii PCC 7110]|uniref:NACHT domain-containing protein n=1 Tax=Scytonema hofmannii PCC 7110 TaxID=128403 RepID=A0A139X8D2_9CYAN|nr:hypothetical protein [Scytonema hofmannii]KYC40948.1 hypothetical protein WA1_25375 [Scytonema hofmannii PCC 7110]